MTTAINVAVTRKSTRETSRELTENELAHVSGGTFTNAFSQVIKTIGEGMSSMARKA
jgi:bacteriocin-like protein